MTDRLFEEGIDGVHGLRRREHSRLWYRATTEDEIVSEHVRSAIQNAPHLSVVAPELLAAARQTPVDGWYGETHDVVIHEWPVDAPSVAAPVAFGTSDDRQERILRRLGEQHNIQPAPVVHIEHETPQAAITDWRNVPANAPTLLLAASSLLDGRMPGPILGPGTTYRILSTGDGIIGLEVRSADGTSQVGYANAVDLACMEPMVLGLAGQGWKTSTKSRLQKITKGLSHVTGSLIGAP